MKNHILLLAVVLLFSCSNSEKKEQITKEIKIEKKEIIGEDGVEEKAVAVIGIEGMSCSVGCAGKIQKTLGNMDGILSCEVDFDNKVANIQFDDSKISEKEMISTIEGLNDGQYSVTKVEIEKTVAKERSAGEEKHASKREKIENPTLKKAAVYGTGSFIKLPNVFSAFIRILAY